MRSATVLRARLFNGIKSTKTRVAGRGENYIRAFTDLRQRNLLALARIIPRAISNADVVLDHVNVWINCARAFFVSLLESMNQSDVHPTKKADRARL